LDDYMLQINQMINFNKSTVFINFEHVQDVKLNNFIFR